MEKYSDQQLRTMVAQARAIAAHTSDAETKAAFTQIADRLEKTSGTCPTVPKAAPNLLIAVLPAGQSSS